MSYQETHVTKTTTTTGSVPLTSSTTTAGVPLVSGTGRPHVSTHGVSNNLSHAGGHLGDAVANIGHAVGHAGHALFNAVDSVSNKAAGHGNEGVHVTQSEHL